MAAELDLYNPQMPADPAQWSVADHIAALREVDSAASWVKVRIAGMLAARHGDGALQRAAAETGIALSTLHSWRSVDQAFPVHDFGRPKFPVGVAEALMAHPHRAELVRQHPDLTVRKARALASQGSDGEPANRDRGRPRKTPKPPVPAGDDTNARNRREDSSRGKGASPRPEPVSPDVKTGTAETTTETSAAATERKPHVCRAFACPECGKTDTAFGEQAGKLMDELQEARKAACGHGAAWHEQAEWLLALAAGKGWAWDGRQFAKPGPAGQAAVAGKHAGHRVTANQKNTRARCETCREWFDTAAAS